MAALGSIGGRLNAHHAVFMDDDSLSIGNCSTAFSMQVIFNIDTKCEDAIKSQI